MIQTQIGELIVGSYFRLIKECELVSYNQRSMEKGQQMEMDVLAVKSENGEQTVYGCEVATHLRGKLYSGTPYEEGWWSKYSNDSYRHSLERLWNKFHEDYNLLTDMFDASDEYVLQFCHRMSQTVHKQRGWPNFSSSFGVG